MSDDRREYDRQRYLKNREKYLERTRQYYLKNKEKHLERVRNWKERHPTIIVWKGMMQRCGYFKGASKFMLDHYADRGITVCEEWRTFENFEKWCLANGWKQGLQLDRIDNDKGYSPDNCRLVTCKENIRNRRNTTRFGGKPLAHWYDAMGHAEGVSYVKFRQRFTHCHWPICRALFEPSRTTYK